MKRAAVSLMLVGVLAGCSGPRSGISVTSAVDACAAALPVARAAVHNRGKLEHVHAVRHNDVREVAHQLGLPPPPSDSPVFNGDSGSPVTSTPLPPEPQPRACLVAFHGNYRQSQVKKPIGATHGQYAIALVWLHKARLIVVIVTDKLPKLLK